MKQIADALKVLYSNTLTHEEASEGDYQVLFILQDALYDLRKLMDRKLGRQDKSSIEIPHLKELPFDGELVVAIDVCEDWPEPYHTSVILKADLKIFELFDVEWRETSLDDTLAELGDELPKNSGVYRLSCTADLATEQGDFGTVLSQYPYLTINSATPIWLPEEEKSGKEDQTMQELRVEEEQS